MTENKAFGMIMKGVGGLYTVRPDLYSRDEDKYITCSARGKLRNSDYVPYPGDRVVIEGEGDSRVITEICERKNSLIRPTAANITHLVAVIPTAKPKPDLLTVDKLILCAESAGIETIVCVSKSDLDGAEAKRIADIYTLAGYHAFCISSENGEGVCALRDHLLSLSAKGANVVFSGASGVGKSTLMNRLFPSLELKSGAVSAKSQRGRHTTRTAELFEICDGLFIADTPGFTMLDFARYNFFPSAELAFLYREFNDCIGKCRYTKCTHLREEGCAVISALNEGKISAERHENYVKIYAEMKKTPDYARRSR